ncbi:MAG: PUR family DNA/RNA-binding protein [Flavobacteriaceae bacterium]|jgi:hypothetical protein|nr:PUR family DNA/RNA-binding protein [Flavobacteriaceae bacterium]
MNDFENVEKKENEIFSKVLRAGKRTYFFDVRETKAGDYYLTITESKKNVSDEGALGFKKFKIYLYKEDFKNFKDILEETTSFIVRETGEKVISERHRDDFHLQSEENKEPQNSASISSSNYTNVDFEDI